MTPDPTPYDALLLVSFGGPERPEDVVPFLENVTRGKNIPRERLEEVGEHYFLFGGRSPLNAQYRAPPRPREVSVTWKRVPASATTNSDSSTMPTARPST